MITIKPTLWKRSVVISFVLFGALCLSPMVFGPPSATSSIAGVGALVGMFLLYEASARVHWHSPIPAIPLACGPRTERAPSGFSLGSTPG